MRKVERTELGVNDGFFKEILHLITGGGKET